MIRIAALLAALAAAAPALAANDEQPTILRGSSAPAEPWYEPPPQPQQAVEHPAYQPIYYYAVPVRRFPAYQHHHHFRR